MSENEVMKSIRFNKIKDKAILDFFEEKGLKYGIKILFEFYQNNKDMASVIVDSIKNEIDFSQQNVVSQNIPKTRIFKKESTKNKEFNTDNDGLDLSGF